MFEPKTKEELQNAVNLWCDDKETALKKYGDINDWDVSNITYAFIISRKKRF